MNSDNNESRSYLMGVITGLVISLLITATVVFCFNYLPIPKIALFNKSLPADTVSTAKTMHKLKTIEDVINNRYALDKVDTAVMEDGVYRGLVESLGDPYSTYYSEEEMNAQQEKLDGVYYGIGCSISLDPDSGRAVIKEVFNDSPAMKAGLLLNDIILEVDDTKVTGWELSDIVALVKGERGTKVRILVLRQTEEGPKEVLIIPKRDSVPRQTVSYALDEDGLGYILITEFDAVTVDQFVDAIATLTGRGMKGLILDLRDNPGGNLQAVTDVARHILPEGIITYTVANDGNRMDFACDGANELKIPIALLLNGNSASASEVLAGAIKDYKKATLIGTTTFGKGIVQSYINLSDGSAIKLTTSKYYTPNGENIHGTGIAPDIEIEYDLEKAKSEGVDNQVDAAIKYLRDELRITAPSNKEGWMGFE